MPSDLVSVIMPAYNSEKWIREAIESVLRQSHQKIELVIVDDCSTDGTLDIIREFADDDRVRVIALRKNVGVANARNVGVTQSVGRYVAYLDSDDCWYPEKIAAQLNFMNDNKCAMCFTAYETITEFGDHISDVYVPDVIDYSGFLKNTITCSHTVVIDTQRVPKDCLVVELEDDYDFPEDMCAWLQVLKTGVSAYGLNLVYAKYRKHKSSRSSNKIKAVRRTWNQYRRKEGLGQLKSLYCLTFQLINAIRKRIA